MYTFIFSVILLFLGYFLYAKFLEKIIKIDVFALSPALLHKDNVDYVPLSWWKAFMIHFLNITGLGPIFGAILGAMYGPIAFIWIVIGNIFGGAMHDYFAGLISMRHDGKSLPELYGYYIGKITKYFMRIFTLFLMLLVGAVFVIGPASIISNLTDNIIPRTLWIVFILLYYFIATLFPIHKIIGRIYPFFGIALVFMALSILVMAIFYNLHFQLPELTIDNFYNMRHNAEQFPVFPMMFISIACGAISGFHGTQAPLIARCLTNERYGRRVFYGAMIMEGLIALIWAAIGMTFWGGVEELNKIMLQQKENASWAVHQISVTLLGVVGSLFATIGVIAAPITSGDTAFRSSRLIVADFLNIPQKQILNRILITIPIFLCGFLLTQLNFGILWRYMAWLNQTLATLTLWIITIYLAKNKKIYFLTLIPTLFMTMVCTSYILISSEGLSLDRNYSIIISGLFTFLCLVFFVKYNYKTNN